MDSGSTYDRESFHLIRSRGLNDIQSPPLPLHEQWCQSVIHTRSYVCIWQHTKCHVSHLILILKSREPLSQHSVIQPLTKKLQSNNKKKRPENWCKPFFMFFWVLDNSLLSSPYSPPFFFRTPVVNKLTFVGTKPQERHNAPVCKMHVCPLHCYLKLV